MNTVGMQRIALTIFALLAILSARAQTPNVLWETLGGGTDKQVQVLLRLSDGDMLVAGTFTMAGSTASSRVARWNGTSYMPMPGFPEYFDITCAAELDGFIYVGGIPPPSDQSSHYDLMTWDGNTWTGQAVCLGSHPYGFHDLFVHDGMLYGSTTNYGILTAMHGVQRFSGAGWTGWEWVGQSLNHEVRRISYFDGHLVCGGDFNANTASPANDIRHVAYLDGNTWVQLGDGLNGAVNDLLVVGDDLYATGDMRSFTETYFGLARLYTGSATWEQLMPNIGDYVPQPASSVMMAGQALEAHNDKVYVGGEFLLSGEVQGRGLAVFHGAPDAVESFCHFEGPVRSLALIDGHELVIAGKSNAYHHIAATDLLTTGVVDEAAYSYFTLSPNPASGVVTVRTNLIAGQGVLVRMLDLNGRLVYTARMANGAELSIDLSGKRPGIYVLEVQAQGQTQRERLVLVP